MKLGSEVYFVCDSCKKFIKRGDGFYTLHYREAGTKYAHEKEHKNYPNGHLCLECSNKVIEEEK